MVSFQVVRWQTKHQKEYGEHVVDSVGDDFENCYCCYYCFDYYCLEFETKQNLLKECRKHLIEYHYFPVAAVGIGTVVAAVEFVVDFAVVVVDQEVTSS